jgi:hypothetical protein
MTIERETDQMTGNVTEDVEIDDFVPRVEATHQDQYVQYTHELPEASADAVWRILVRVVPLAYGALFGALFDHMALGLTVAFGISVIADLKMREQSLLRASAARVYVTTCPVIAMIAHGLAAVIGRLGPMPRVLSEMQCKAPRT